MHHIESLENRQLLSAVIHSAKTAKPKPAIPDVVGQFTGTGIETKPINATGHLVLNIETESVKGVFAGTATNTTADKSGTCTGTVTVKDKVTIKIIDSITHKTSFTFTGTYSDTTGEIVGKYKGAASKAVKASSGTFSLTRVPD